MKALLSLLLVLPISAMAQSGAPSWQKATLISFRTVDAGSSCNTTGNVNAKADENGNINGTANSDTDCNDRTETLYTLRVGPNIFVVEPTISGGRKAGEFAFLTGTAGMGVFFLRNHVSLQNQLPGTSALIRQHGDLVEVAVGKHHSLYSVVAAK